MLTLCLHVVNWTYG